MTTTFDKPIAKNQKILLSVVPGFLATLGLVNAEYSSWSTIGIILLLIFVIAAWFKNNRQLPDWSLLSVGILIGVAQPMLLGVIGVLVAQITGTSPSPTASPFVLALPWIGIVVIYMVSKHDRHSISRDWLLIAVIVLCSILVRVKYFVLFGISWEILWEMLGVSLWSAGTLLLPILAVGLLAGRFGETSVLFSVGATFAWYQVLIDNAYKVSAIIGSPVLFWGYLFVVQVLFIVVGPILFLQAKGLRQKLTGLVVSICVSVMLNIVISGLLRGDFTLIIWLAAIPYTISIGLTPLLACWLYKSAGKERVATITR